MTVNPDDFIITRKRKKYKFAHFANLENCFEAGQWRLSDVNQANLPISVELGAGTGLFALELARRHQDRFYIAIDVKADRLYTSAKQAKQEDLDNIVFLRAHAQQLPELFDSASIDELWLTFSDPFPKKRHIKHRLTHPAFLDIYHVLMTPDAQLRMKTDNHDLFDWSLEQLVAGGWSIDELSYDLHDSNLSDDYKITTTFESHFLEQGLAIYFVSAKC